MTPLRLQFLGYVQARLREIVRITSSAPPNPTTARTGPQHAGQPAEKTRIAVALVKNLRILRWSKLPLFQGWPFGRRDASPDPAKYKRGGHVRGLDFPKSPMKTNLRAATSSVRVAASAGRVKMAENKGISARSTRHRSLPARPGHLVRGTARSSS